MLIRIKVDIFDGRTTLRARDVVEVDDKIGADYIRHGWAEEVQPEPEPEPKPRRRRRSEP